MARRRSSAERASTPGHASSRRSAAVRCAVYTRKSTEEGLEQAFNSLDAQRESCEAYVLSQAGEGWECLPELYDDGGWSGGNMDRPGLKQLLADVAAGKVDDGEPAHAEQHGLLAVDPAIVRAAMEDRGRHRLTHVRRRCRLPRGGGETHDAAHQAFASR